MDMSTFKILITVVILSILILQPVNAGKLTFHNVAMKFGNS
jgi:uncharacterized membrane protein (DUF441 family)